MARARIGNLVRMPSHRYARPLSAVAVACAAGVLLSACGGDDSTATSTPTLTPATSTSVAAPSAPSASSQAPAESPSANATAQPQPSQQANPTTKPGAAATAPPETPQNQPSGFPGPTPSVSKGSREEAFIAELKKRGITPIGNGESAISTANFICSALQAKAPESEFMVTVNAAAGVEDSSTGGKKSAEEAGKIFLEAAKATYCK